MKKILIQAWILCALAFLPAMGSALFHPRKPAWEEKLSKGEVTLSIVKAWGKPVLWIDARTRTEFEKGHIPSAKRLNEDEWGSLFMAILESWSPGQPVVVYCNGETCEASQHVAERLRKSGIESVFVLKGGWSAWEKDQK